MSLEKENHSKQEDALLWQGIRNGDPIAFDRLIKKYTGLLFTYGSRFCQDRDIVKDCVQELFVEIWNKRTVINEPASLKWYLFVAVRNRVFREQTKWKKNETLGDNEYNFFLEYSIEEKIIKYTEDIELAKKIKKILESLPPRQREIIYLRYYENLNYDQIADLMQINKQSVHNLLQKAYKNIRVDWVPLVCLLYSLS